MYKVKLVIAPDNIGCARQLPTDNYEWKGYRFYINQEVEDPDFWVVYSKGQFKTETCRCAPENTLFITGEPETIYHYSSGFIKQFAKVVSCQKRIKHPNVAYSQPGLAWHIGRVCKDGVYSYTKTYGDFVRAVPHKDKLISVISSSKVYTKGHADRIDFVQKLKAHFGDSIDVFGRGINDFLDKWDVIAPYKYHVVLENSAYDDYWTEKLADAYLGDAYPIYFGAPNIGEYFDEKAYTMIDINKPDEAIAKIEWLLSHDIYEERKNEITEAKAKVLNEYNLFEVIIANLEEMNPNNEKKVLTLKHDLAFFDWTKLGIMWGRLVTKVKSIIKNRHEK